MLQTAGKPVAHPANGRVACPVSSGQTKLAESGLISGRLVYWPVPMKNRTKFPIPPFQPTTAPPTHS
jgi:hypothetical protein